MSVKDLIIDQLACSVDGTPGINVQSDDFHALNSAQVDRLIYWADSYGYRKPKTASGSRARCFFELLARHARKGGN